MSWSLSRFRAGELVEVRSRDEILATLDAEGCIDGMPFMPEMLASCGRTFRVSAVAHKSCETANRTWKGRRLDATVHLVGSRCNGSAHGGCEADCNLFWKDAWLKPAAAVADAASVGTSESPKNGTAPCAKPACGGCTVELLQLKTRLPSQSENDEPAWSCQATKHPEATRPLAWWNPTQYLRDITTGNHRPLHVLRVLFVGVLSQALRSAPVGYRAIKSVRERMHRLVTGRNGIDVEGKIPHGNATPTGRLNLQPGERVRVKSKAEIEKTLKEDGTNRGMSFGQEMLPYCGRELVVRDVVTRIIDEKTGRMIPMKNPCITLQGAVCRAEYSDCRLLCPRQIPSFWREIWLERVDEKRPDDAEQPAEALAVVGSAS